MTEQRRALIIFAAIVAAVAVAILLAVALDAPWLPGGVVVLATGWIASRLTESR